MAIKSDWPSNYGQLGDSNKTYNAHLIAIDYSAGVEDEIPEATLKAYCRNADMWDCASAILVPFADQDPDPKFRDYMYNPLEVFDQQSARDVAAALATLDESTFFEKHGAFYCAEGQYVVANLGPQEDENGGTLLKKSRYGDTAFGRLIANFIAAPGYAGMSAEQREKTSADRLGIFAGARPRQWRHQPRRKASSSPPPTVRAWRSTGSPEDIKGWQAYRPKLDEALIARPMTVATIAWALLRLYMPRDAVARAVAADIGRAYAQGDDAVKDSVKLLIGGDPTTPAGQALLAVVGAKAATGLLLGLLSSEEVAASLLAKAGFNEITNDADKERVKTAYREFLGILQNADYSTQGALDRALAEADAKLGALTVTRSFFNRATQQRLPAKSTVMKYSAPPCFGMWAQQPFLAGTGCLRYVATAMHVSQKKSPAS